MNVHLIYPEQARANNINGRIIVQFLVDEQGSLSHTQILRSIGLGCDEAVWKLINDMPLWTRLPTKTNR
jgi:protein TonB